VKSTLVGCDCLTSSSNFHLELHCNTFSHEWIQILYHASIYMINMQSYKIVKESSVGGFGIKPFVYQNIRLFQLVKFDAKGSAAKPQELLSPFSSFRIHLSTSTLCHLQSNKISPATQGVKVSVRLLVFPHDATPGVNLTHPASHSLGFAREVSSSLTPNAFKFDYNMCFRGQEVPGERGVSKRLKVFSRQAHMMTTRKAPRFAAWRHVAPITWRPNWRLPKNSLEHPVLVLFTWGHSRNVKSPLASL
jgi:hypothetical protein